ncbi:DUF6884 domain-containing protein [Halorubrum trueperi]|uniref:DUF6884 domain-containing protein n=1 Tax=Halorubrum trueperi TaxID=2004704 RepID=A0ABD5UJL3_9EURY
MLSAKHHLLDPDGNPIESYDETLSGASVDTKRKWAETVFEQLRVEGLLGSEGLVAMWVVRIGCVL